MNNNNNLDKQIFDDLFLKIEEQKTERDRILAENVILVEENKQLIQRNHELENELRNIYQSRSYRIFHNRITRYLGKFRHRGRTKRVETTVPSRCILTPSVQQCAQETELCVKISVVVPTYNGADTLIRQFGMLSGQVGIREIELIMVDSGSSDDTLEIGKMFGAQIIQIKQEEFSHSYARNLGAQKSTGDYLLFMTQDAIPTDEFWVYRLFAPIVQGHVVAVSPMELETDAGDMKYKIDIESHMRFLGVYDSDKIGSLPAHQDYYNMRVNGQLCDVTCLIKKDVFEKYQYHGSFAEDLDLGLKLIRDGYHIGLVSSTRVLHSHHRSATYNLKRSYVDVKRIKELLSDYPMSKRTLDELIQLVAEEYLYVNSFIINMINCFEDCSMQQYINFIKAQISRPINLETEHVAAPIYDATLMNIIDSFVPEDRRNNLKGAARSMPEEFALYLEHSVIPYISARYEVVDQTLNQEIMDAFYKTFASFLGVKIAEYQYYANGDDVVTELATRLSQGV